MDHKLMRTLHKIIKHRSVDLNTSSDPFNGAGPGSYPPPYTGSADDGRDKEQDREHGEGDDWGDDGDNNDFSLIGEEDFPLQVMYCTVVWCGVLCFAVVWCTVLWCDALLCGVLYCAVV